MIVGMFRRFFVFVFYFHVTLPNTSMVNGATNISSTIDDQCTSSEFLFWNVCTTILLLLFGVSTYFQYGFAEKNMQDYKLSKNMNIEKVFF